MSFTIHLLTRQPFPAGLRLSATWDDPDDPIAGRRRYGVVVGLSSARVRELSTTKLRAAWGRSKDTAKSPADDRWLPQSRVFLDKGSDTAIEVGEALADALGGVMVLDGWVDDYEEKDSIFYVSENVPGVAPSKDELRAIFKRKIAAAKSAAKKVAEARRKKAREDFTQELRSAAATAAATLTATLEKAARGDTDPLPAMLLANDNDRALHAAVRNFVSEGERPELLGLASKMEYGVQRGLAACLTTSRLLVVPVDVETSAPGHRFAHPLSVKAKPGAKPVYDVKRSDVQTLRINAGAPDVIHLWPLLELTMHQPISLDSDADVPLSNQRAFRAHLASELVRGGAKWTVGPGWW